MEDQESVDCGGELLVITAGPPGAGKSSAVELVPKVEGCRRLDPDRVKELIIGRAVEDRIYEDLLCEYLADGRPVMPNELSGLVHEESVRLTDEIKRRCLLAGESVLIEGTLNWPPLIDVYLSDLARYRYDNLAIISVDVPKGVAWQRAEERWWMDRSDTSNLNGGRFVSRAVIEASYHVNGTSFGRIHAVQLADRARRAGITVTLESLGGSGADPDYGYPDVSSSARGSGPSE